MHARRVLLVVVTALLSFTLVSAPNASAVEYKCGGWSCNMQWPQDMNCDDDPNRRTLQSILVGGFVTIEMRYSPACAALWVRYTNHHNGHGGKNLIAAYMNGQHYKTHEIGNNPTAGASGWTRMFSVHLEAHGCHKYSTQWGEQQECTHTF
jgi:hypothetical protein